MKKHLQQLSTEPAPPGARPISRLFNRFYWLQIGLIAFAVILGISFSAMIIKNLLIKTAMEQEAAHYWHRYEQNPQAALPDTKNLYGYRWRERPPAVLKDLPLEKGVHRLFIDGKDRVTIYDEHDGHKLLLIFGESNVNRLIWLFGLAPLMASLVLLYSILWMVNRRAHRHFSPVAQLAQTLLDIDLSEPKLNRRPFAHIDTRGNLEADELKKALQVYHQTLIEFIEREQQFTAEVSHELRTPLSVIKGGLELLVLKHPQEATLTRLQHVINGMQLLMDTLLTIARQGSSRLPLNDMDLADAMRQTCADLGELFTQRDMRFDIKVLRENRAQANPTLVSMIFSNIIRNALNYSQGRHVSIVVDAARIVIEDDGIGLSEAARASLLRDDGVGHVSHQGFGIGLKLVRRLCGMTGWRIELMNKASLNQHSLILNGNEGLAVVIYTGDAA